MNKAELPKIRTSKYPGLEFLTPPPHHSPPLHCEFDGIHMELNL